MILLTSERSIEISRFMARFCTILTPTCVSEAAQNRQIISRMNIKKNRPITEVVESVYIHLIKLPRFPYLNFVDSRVKNGVSTCIKV